MKPNIFIVYVTDMERSTAFYSDLFDMKPQMLTATYVPFKICSDVVFALCKGKAEALKPSVPRSSELGLMIAGAADKIDELFVLWKEKGAAVVEEPHNEDYGRTFLVADPDGNLIRVSPLE